MSGLIVQFLILLAVVASFAGFIFYLFLNWPLYVFTASLVLVALNLAISYRDKWKLLAQLGTNGYVKISESESNTFTGIYRPHWETGHIQVPMAKRGVLGFPTFEYWDPSFECDVGELDSEDGRLRDGSRQFLITFVGTPSKLGRFGHMGMMNRRVVIGAIVDLKPL